MRFNSLRGVRLLQSQTGSSVMSSSVGRTGGATTLSNTAEWFCRRSYSVRNHGVRPGSSSSSNVRVGSTHVNAFASRHNWLSSAPLWAQQRREKSYILRFTRGHLPHDLKDMPGAFIGCLYDSLPDADEYAAYRVPKKNCDSYEQLGYLRTPQPILNAMQCDVLADEVMALANNVEHHPRTDVLYNTSLADLTGGPLFFCQGQWRAAWGMHDLIYLPSLCVAASQLLGNVEVQLWYDEVLMKAPRIGPCIPWQQNYARWQHTYPINHLTVVIALDTLTAEKGALCVVPGSHRWREGQLLDNVPPYDPSLDEAAHMNSIWDFVNEEERESLMDIPPETIELQRGQALFLHPMTVYATHANRTFDPSRCVMLHYMGPTFTTRAGAVLPRTTRFPEKTRIQGPYFPVVFDPSIVEEPVADAVPQVEA